MKKGVIFIAVLILCTATSFAFDGQRRGFVLGGGVGFGYAEASSDNYPLDKGLRYETMRAYLDAEDISSAGLSLNFLIGYAWDDQNMIVFLRDGVLYSEGTISGGSSILGQGFSGLGYYHYFGLPGRSFFVTAGLGFQDWMPFEGDYKDNNLGYGLLAGAGYEFTRHVQVVGSFFFGETSDAVADFSHIQFTLGVSAVAF